MPRDEKGVLIYEEQTSIEETWEVQSSEISLHFRKN